MIEPEELPDHWKELIDDYLDGLLDEAGMEELECHLRADRGARHYFINYARVHTDLYLEARARNAAARAIERLEQQTEVPSISGYGATQIPERIAPISTVPAKMISWLPKPQRLTIAAGILAAIIAGGWLARGWVGLSRNDEDLAVAWLVNAQDCTWSDSGLTGNLPAGTTLKIERGLAEFHFQCGARILVEGPSEVQLLSNRSARLVSGKLTARVPAEAIGFEVLSPHGKVVDLGTEFGLHSGKGSTEVYVFEGIVEAHPMSESQASAQSVNLKKHQAAQMTSSTIRPIEPTGGDAQFVRTIVPPPVVVPRTLNLPFNHAIDGSIKDKSGWGTGLTHRLPGTGRLLPDCDANLRLNRDKSQLELTTTNTDLNTQYQLDKGEYFGVRLADLGFTGKEDFAVAVTVHNIPALEVVGQFGLYAGARSDRSIRGGLIVQCPDDGARSNPASGNQSPHSLDTNRKPKARDGSRTQIEPGQYTQYLVNNDKGIDTADICKVGLLSTGTDLRLTLKRTGGKYSLTVENLTEGSTSTLTIRHPDFLDSENDMYIGLYGANTQSEVRKTLVFKDFQATVWTVATTASK
jgi:hypothetical protein